MCVVTALSLCACATSSTPSPLVGTWRQVATLEADGTEQPVRQSDVIVLELRPDGDATIFMPGRTENGEPWTWWAGESQLKVTDNPGGSLRTGFSLGYELDGDRLTMDWITVGPQIIFERQ